MAIEVNSELIFEVSTVCSSVLLTCECVVFLLFIISWCRSDTRNWQIGRFSFGAMFLGICAYCFELVSVAEIDFAKSNDFCNYGVRFLLVFVVCFVFELCRHV